MHDLRGLAEDIAKRRRMEAQFSEGVLSIAIEGEDVLICEDANDGRLVIWGVVADLQSHELPSAAEASLRYNEQFAYASGASLGVSSQEKRAILGRSMEADGLDGDRLLDDARAFRAEFGVAKTFFQTALTEAMRAAAQNEPTHDMQSQDYRRI